MTDPPIPIIAMPAPHHRVAFHGPLLTEPPGTDDALNLWDAVIRSRDCRRSSAPIPPASTNYHVHARPPPEQVPRTGGKPKLPESALISVVLVHLRRDRDEHR